MFDDEEELELDVVGGVVVLLVVGVVGVCDGSGVSDRVAVLVDVELGTGGVLEEADVGAAAVEDEEGAGVLGVVDWASVGRCMSRLAALVPSRWASSAFAAAAAAAVFESWDAASALLRSPS